ncbi:MAG: CDP-alcohol phosphatidyltransferase family protein [Mariprofundaceae bacterium]
MRDLINVPNLLTIARIMIVPFVVYAILRQQPLIAFSLMIVAGITDMLDGAIAKHFGQQTKVGSYLDPIADKVMLISTMIALFLVEQLPLYLFLAVLFRDTMIMLGAVAYELVTHRLTMQPSMASKVTTVVQIIYVLIAILDMALAIPDDLMLLAAFITFATTCYSGVQYLFVWTVKATDVEES